MNEGRAAADLTPAVERCRADYVRAVLARDAGAARTAVGAALAEGVPARDLLLDVFPGALEHVGSCWALDEINVAQEHYATAVTQEIITSLGPQVRLPPVDGRLAVVTASPDELHVLGPQILALMLEGEGWEVLWLGAATPALDLAELVAAERPDVVALSTSTAGRVGGVVDALRALDRLRPRPLLAMGGGLYTQQAADYARAQGADVVTSDVREFLSQLRRRFPPV